MKRIQIVDSHTEGEPTRVVMEGGPTIASGPWPERLRRLHEEHDAWRSAVINEPRGSDVLVGAFLCPPSDASCLTGVIFFNNVGYLGMCGHGTIGLLTTLAHRQRLQPGNYRIETPVGIVTARLCPDGAVTVENVPSYRKAKAVVVDIPGHGRLTGDVAWGGNWFFLVQDYAGELALDRAEALTDFTWRVRRSVNEQGFPEVDHVELFGPPVLKHAHSRNFVLCPGKAYDRSPCGTGTSAKLACLAADGKLAEGTRWVQESIVGSTFTGEYRWLDRAAGKIVPTITGRAYLTAEATLVLDPTDPFCWGIARGSVSKQQ
jgi:4-hydroxyproline epimerase